MEFLGLILDLNPQEWAKRAVPSNDPNALPSLSQVVAHCLMFINAFKLLNRSNRLAVIGAHPSTAEYLYVSPSSNEMNDQSKQSESISQILTAAISEIMMNPIDEDNSDEPLISGGLSLLLCQIARVKREYQSARCRILVITVSPDVTRQYIGVMNAIFTAHKLQVIVDACVLHNENSLLMQQACSITNGIYVQLPASDQRALLTHLLLTFITDINSRNHLILPAQSNIDFRATCFCHRTVVETAMVCPVCLAIYCKSTPRCSTCQSKFAVTVQRVAARPSQAPRAIASPTQQAVTET